ncbi:winged helix-turn-helix domain-containing protein [Shewanella sp. SP1S2-4]|uniref:winged helix-turn-helix domain-containing protein n=1 Tax=Shewanella sp. SP1S2-4 TaxID=3063537 RepID=UPI00288D72DB|nr:winged helix-turn-helix domain-containing protein [Shewanella sp. SP1S2-4]MDT3318163.1 winged helix-turn-helix domain-containing protein [Shewanella sp. SP1S2-4]
MADMLAQAKARQCTIAIDELVYDPASRQLSKNAQGIELEPRSIELLEVFLQQTGTPIAAEDIISRVWQSNYISKNVLTNRISTLRAIFKESSPELDATKLLVTYPKKGYYLNATRVTLIDSAADLIAPSKPVQSKIMIHLVYMGLLMIAGFFIYQQSQKLPIIAPVNPLTATTRQDAHITIAVVELVLNRIHVTNSAASPYVTAIKTALLSQLVAYPYINVLNQDDPTYFLSPLNDSEYWPGDGNTLFSDYKLNLRLDKAPTSDQLTARVELVYHSSEKQTYRGEYILSTGSLDQDIQKITDDLIDYFKLPVIASANTEQTHTFINQTLAQQLDTDNPSMFQANYLARRLLLDPELKSDQIQTWLNRIDKLFPFPSEETEIWLGLLDFRIGNHKRARERLLKGHFNNQIDNAFIYLVLSNIALKDDKPELFRYYYLKSLVSLSLVVPSKTVFEQLSREKLTSQCLGVWGVLFQDKALTADIHSWAMFANYCDTAAPYLPKASAKRSQ